MTRPGAWDCHKGENLCGLMPSRASESIVLASDNGGFLSFESVLRQLCNTYIYFPQDGLMFRKHMVVRVILFVTDANSDAMRRRNKGLWSGSEAYTLTVQERLP